MSLPGENSAVALFKAAKIHKALKQKLAKAKCYEGVGESFARAQKWEKSQEFLQKALRGFSRLAEFEAALRVSQTLTAQFESLKLAEAQTTQMRCTLDLLGKLKHQNMEILLLKIKLADRLVFQTSRKEAVEEAIGVFSPVVPVGGRRLHEQRRNQISHKKPAREGSDGVFGAGGDLIRTKPGLCN